MLLYTEARDGIRLVAECHASTGRPLLLLHGGGQNRHSWKEAGEKLALRGFLPVSLDMRSHGDSPPSPDGQYPLELFIDDLVRVARRFDPTPILVGASLGGIISLLAIGEGHLAADTPLTLVDISLRSGLGGVERVMNFMLQTQDGFASLEQATEAISVYLQEPPKPGAAQRLGQYLRQDQNGRFRWHWHTSILTGMNMDEVLDVERKRRAARKLRGPVILLRGAHSDMVTPDMAEEFVREVPQARWIDVKQAQHTAAGSSNTRFTDALVSALSELMRDHPDDQHYGQQ
jgi:pimeloyl-ACP methyl ester carboxylesterase